MTSGLRKSFLLEDFLSVNRYSSVRGKFALEHGHSLRTKIDDSVGVKKPKMSEELVQWVRHLYAYKYACTFAHGKVVLDVGCGTGYGVNELSAAAQIVIGIDIWREGILYCHSRYCDKAFFIRASALNLPIRSNLFDLVTSFQVIEHFDTKMVSAYLGEMKRVLKKDATFIVTTPNRKLRLLPFQKPWNPDHKKEYDARELRRELESIFVNVKILGLSATKEAYLIEYYRVRQNPFYAYLIRPTVSLIRRFLPDLAFIKVLYARLRLEKDMLYKTRRSKTCSFNITLKDFHISSKDLETCLDLYGICEK